VSLGGSVLLRALPAVQAQVRSAILIGAPLQIVLSPRSILGEIGASTIALLWREREHYGLTGLIPSFGPFKRDTYPLRLGRKAPAGAFGYVAVLNQALAEMELEKAAAAARVPVLLVYGTSDRVVPIEQGEELARTMPDAELFRLSGGTHLSTPLESATLERLISWIDSHE
jgi:pimeloyl-ACP methyl ester carboxylesterase